MVTAAKRSGPPEIFFHHAKVSFTAQAFFRLPRHVPSHVPVVHHVGMKYPPVSGPSMLGSSGSGVAGPDPGLFTRSVPPPLVTGSLGSMPTAASAANSA